MDQVTPLASPVSPSQHPTGSDDSSSPAVSSVSSQMTSTDNGQHLVWIGNPQQPTITTPTVERLLPVGNTANKTGQRIPQRVLRCEDAYGSPESPLSKMDILTVSKFKRTWRCIFYSCFHLYGNLPLTYPPPFPLFSFFPFLSPVTSATSFPTARATFLPYRQSYPPWKCDRIHSLLCCIAFAQGHRETAENLCRYSLPLNRVCPQSNSL